MLVPLSWLKEYVDFNAKAQEVADLLQAVGIPVENVEKQGPEVSGVMTCRIASVEPHPDAERLRVCQVDLGDHTLQIVTAATNVAVDQITAVAVHGAVLASGTKIKKGKLRGVVSEGMFCGWEEAGVDPDLLPKSCLEGILELPAGLPLGKPLGDVFTTGEEILVLESFANRPDQLSILGIARELAAKLGVPLKMPALAETPADGGAEAAKYANLITVEDEKACPRYVGRVVEDVHIGPSPRFMVKRLEAAGMRSINNVVDITNYVMLETGQPLHAFDIDTLDEERLVVRRAKPGEIITTLDGGERQLPENTIVIADASKVVGVAGVMGGLNSEITENTHRLILESAAFDCGDVRRASLRLGLRTEASKRYEKGMDLMRTEMASARAAYLFQQYAGKVVDMVVRCGLENPEPNRVILRQERIKRVLGIALEPARVLEILRSLEFGVEESQPGVYTVSVPSHRQDVTEEVDVIEELARHFGYDNLPVTLPGSSHLAAPVYDDAHFEWLRDCMMNLGLNDVLTPSLHSRDVLEKFHIEGEFAEIFNPLSEDQRVLRPYVFPFLVEVVAHNLKVRCRDLRIFEISHVYVKDGENVREPRHLSMAVCYEKAGFFNIKGLVEKLAAMAKVELSVKPVLKSWLHPGRAAEILIDGKVVGWMGELHPSLAHACDIDLPLMLAEIDCAALVPDEERSAYRPFSRLQSVEKDLAFVVAEDVPAGDISARMKQVGGSITESVFCFDDYRSEQLGQGVKSLAFRALFTPSEHTLTDDEIAKLMKKMQKVVEREFNAKLRD